MSIDYKSKFEITVAKRLKRLKAARFKYEMEKLPYTWEAVYIPDFTSMKTGTIIEVKGYLDATDRRKMIAVKKAHPNRRIVFLFMKPHQKMPRTKTTHAEWAIKRGFEWCTLENVGDYV